MQIEARAPLARWWIYQRERFPLLAHGPLVMAFSLSALSVSSGLRGTSGFSFGAGAVALGSSLIFFLLLRVAYEFKDFADDCRYRPYRPVQRGLVSLRELGVLGVGAAAVQLALALALSPNLIPLLIGVWGYFALMSAEFFAPERLRRRPLLYLVSHMAIVPLIDLYATACDWLVAGAPPPAGLEWFCAASFFNGIVIEIGRKVRAPEDEEAGVETYTALWGRPRAMLAWTFALVLAALTGSVTGVLLGAGWLLAGVFAAFCLVGGVLAAWFVRRPAGRAKTVEAFSGGWTLTLYLGLGLSAHFG
ncbi:MAG: UbiA family prenyltransferase [Rhodothermales bacterium]